SRRFWVCHFVVAAIIGTCEKNWDAHKAAGWVAVVFIWIFGVGFGYSWGPCGSSSNRPNNFAVAMATPDFVTAASWGVYIFLGMMCIFGAADIFFLVPETMGRTLNEMDELFEDNSGRARADAAVLEQTFRDVGLLQAAGLETGTPKNNKDMGLIPLD
ncbi:hypothetical protein FS837_005878, partial [Tulasnella sp. UAMH 9824]